MIWRGKKPPECPCESGNKTESKCCDASCDEIKKLKSEISELRQKNESLRSENISLDSRATAFETEYRITFDAYKKYYIHSKYTTPAFKIEDVVDGKKLNAIRFNVKQGERSNSYTYEYHAYGYGVYTLVNYIIINENEKWIMKGYASIGKPVVNSKNEAYSYNMPTSGIYEFPNLEFDSREELLKYINDETKGFCNTFNNKWLFEYEFEKS